LNVHNDGVYALAVFADGKRFVSGGADGTVEIWGVPTVDCPEAAEEEGWDEVCTLSGHDDEVNAVAVFPDATRVLSGSDDGTVKIWDAKSGCEIGQCGDLAFDVGGPEWTSSRTGSVCSVAVFPDCKKVMWGCCDGTINIWDADLRRDWEADELTGHDGEVYALAVFADGKSIHLTIMPSQFIRLPVPPQIGIPNVDRTITTTPHHLLAIRKHSN
jgi:WD40 repeat protein